MQRAHDIAVGGSPPAQHHRLAVAAYVGNQLHPLRGAHQCATVAFLWQGVVVADLGHRERVPEVARTVAEQRFMLALEQRSVEIAGDRQLRTATLEGVAGDAQVGHDPQDLQKPMSNAPPVGCRPVGSTEVPDRGNTPQIVSTQVSRG